MTRAGVIVRYSVMIAVIVVALFPIYWMFVTASLPGELFQVPPRLLPRMHFWGTVQNVLQSTPMLSWLRNSAVIAFGTALTSVAMALLVGYALSRFRFRGRGGFGFMLFASQMLPEALIVVPLYSLFLHFALLDGHFGLVLVNASFMMPVVAWILKAAIDAVPLELEEAARVDGCRRFAILTTVVLPVIMPSVAAGAVIAFFHGWNEYLFAVTFIQTEAMWPASVGLASFIGEYITPIDQIMAAATVYAIPALVFFMAAQRRVVSGLTAGSVKG